MIKMEKIAIGVPGWLDGWQRLFDDQPQALQQHYRYLMALTALGADMDMVYFYRQQEMVAFAAMARRKIFRLITLDSCFRAPVFTAQVTETEKIEIFKLISALGRKWRWHFVNIQPDMPATDQALGLMKQAGLRQVMTGFSTAWLDLRPSGESLRQGLAGKWRNQLQKSEKADFDVTYSFDKRKNYQWLLEEDHSHAKMKGYPATPKALIYSYEEISQIIDQGRHAGGPSLPAVLMVTAHKRREKLAGGLFLLHGNSATYQIGWTSPAGRPLNAQNRVLWQAILQLKAQGIKFLDMGGFETAEMAPLARFKLGTGAKPITYCGAFV